MVDDGEGNKVVNPEYVKFSQQDSSLASWLLASISSAIRKGLVGCMTATSIWSKLHQHFLSPSISCKMNIHDRLKVRKLFNQSMRDDLTNIQLICDIPAGCGLPIKEMQQTSIILNGVKVQYNNVVFVIHANWYPYDLASQGQALDSGQAQVKDTGQIQSHQAQSQITPEFQAHKSGYWRVWRRERGYNNKPQCQLCDKIGDLVNRCLQRFDVHFQEVTARPMDISVKLVSWSDEEVQSASAT